MDWQQPMWRETTLLTDRAVHLRECQNLSLFWLNAVSGRYQYWTSPIMGKQGFAGFWKHIIFWIGSDREQMEFEWKNFPGFATLRILDEIQKTMISDLTCEPEHFQGRIILMSMFNDIVWTKRGNREKMYCECSRSYWVYSKIHGRTLVVSGAWVGEEMVRDSRVKTRRTMRRSCWEYDDQLREKRTSYNPCNQRFRKINIEKKGEGMKNIHFNGSDETIELILRTIFSSISSVSTEQ